MGNSGGLREDFLVYKALALDFVKEGDVSGFVEACGNIRTILTSVGKEKFGPKFMPSNKYNGFKAVELSPREDWGSQKISRAALHSLIQEYSPGSVTYESRKQDAEKNLQIRKMYEEKEWADEFEGRAEELLGRNEVFSKPLESLSEKEWGFRFDYLLNRFFSDFDWERTRLPVYFHAIRRCAEHGNVSAVRDLARICVEDSYSIRREYRDMLDLLEARGSKDLTRYGILSKATEKLGNWIDNLEKGGPLLEYLLNVASSNNSGGFVREDE